jgi:hypothetical protein
MKPSLIFCKQFVNKHGEEKPEEKTEEPTAEPIKKRRGRKPGLKKEEPVNTFKIENKEIIISFS